MRQSVRALILLASLALAWGGWKGLNAVLAAGPVRPIQTGQGETTMPRSVRKTESEWKSSLTPEQYKVMFQCGTEAPFSGRYNDFWDKGSYLCAACEVTLFSSEAKYDHGTGWPSFTVPFSEANIEYREDSSLGMVRTEVRCSACGAHLGHVFDDGPAPAGRHYCINSAAMIFRAAAAAKPKTATATFAAGCFWGVEDKLGRVPGVLSTEAGYTGGTVPDPSYERVCRDDTGHAEAVRVIFDPARVSYDDLVRAFFSLHDPTQVDRQGPDIGTQYRSVIFIHDEAQRAAAEKVKADLGREGRYRRPIATRIVPAGPFYPAEEYHQKYFEKNKRGACAL
ncbi:MAG: bifunctional methionine sulfoxide reductase B/A protein [Acidobacteriota bacterium]|nr:bifunctional methionine sulfoxide reductase B/A protein [Acidobacteriota bacterium]